MSSYEGKKELAFSNALFLSNQFLKVYLTDFLGIFSSIIAVW